MWTELPIWTQMVHYHYVIMILSYFANKDLPRTWLYPNLYVDAACFGKLNLLFLLSWPIITCTDLRDSQEMFKTSLAAATGIDPSAIEIVPCQPQMWWLPGSMVSSLGIYVPGSPAAPNPTQ